LANTVSLLKKIVSNRESDVALKIWELIKEPLWNYGWWGSFEECLHLLIESVSEVGSNDQAVSRLIICDLAWLKFWKGRYVESKMLLLSEYKKINRRLKDNLLVSCIAEQKIGFHMIFDEKFIQAEKWIQKSIKTAEKLGSNNSILLAESHMFLGHIWRLKQKFSKAIEEYSSALSAFGRLNSKKVAICEYYLGLTYLGMGKLELCKKKLFSSLAKEREAKRKAGVGWCMIAISQYFSTLEKFRESKRYLLYGKKILNDICVAYPNKLEQVVVVKL
jgi:tetratricopeptide (TPR) repeat protein